MSGNLRSQTYCAIIQNQGPMKTYFLSSALIVLFALTGSCLFSQTKGGPRATDALVTHIDSTIRPVDDFFLSTNGKWFKENPIPPSEQNNGLWQMIQDTINAQIRNVCESSAALTNADKGSNKQKIGDFFHSGMDSVALNKKAIADLKSDFDMIDGVKDMKGNVKAAAYIQIVAGSPL